MSGTQSISFYSNATVLDKDFKLPKNFSYAINEVLLNNNAVGIAVGRYDDNLSILYVSDFLLRLVGHDPLNLLNNDKTYGLREFIHTKDLNKFDIDTFKNYVGNIDFNIVDLHGNPKFVHAYKENVNDDNGDLWVMSIRASDDIKALKVLNKMFANGLWRISFDTDGDVYKVYYSDDFRKMLGFESQDDFPNRISSVLDRVHPWDIDYLNYMFYTSINDPSHEFEFKCQARILNKNNKYVWFEINSDINWRPNGTVYEILGVLVNIDKTKTAQLEQEHMQSFRDAFSRKDIVEYYVNLNSNKFDRLKVNETLIPIFKTSKTWDELINNLIDNYVVKEDAETLKLFYNRDYILKKMNQHVDEISQEVRMKLNGEIRNVRNVIMRGNPDSNGFYSNVAIYLRDITESKKSIAEREAMIESNLNLNQLIQGMVRLVDLFIVIDLENDIYDIYDIDEADDTQGVYSEFVNSFKDKFTLLSSDDDPIELFNVENLRKMFIHQDDIARFEYAYKDRKKIENASFIPVRWDENNKLTKLLIVGQDVTYEREKELEVQNALKDAYEMANKANKSKTDFLSKMSHDIRTPMNAIIGMTSIAKAHINDKDKLIDSLNKITISSKHLLSLINEVLDMSRIESGKVSLANDEFNISDLIDDLINMVTPDMNKHHHDFYVNINDLVHEDVYGDSLRLQLVFTNILSNAIKYTSDGGRISFDLTELPTNNNDIACYKIVIEDNGMGMSEEFVKIIFDPFTRAGDKRTSEIQGTGLGMAITKSIVNMMDGDIKVESKLNEGSKFTLTLFLKTNNKQIEIIKELKDLSVLIVDENIKTCKQVCLVLKQSGMKADYASTNKEMIDKVISKHRSNDDYFAIIVDIDKNNLNALSSIREIRKQIGQDNPRFILACLDNEDIEQEAKQLGINDFISRPLFKSKIITKFKQILNEGNGDFDTKNELDYLANDDYSSKRILLVEDNDLNREIAKEILSTTNCLIEEAFNGKEALDLVREKPKGYYDLIFMDIQMPILNGYEATKAIRLLAEDKGKNLPIIAMTANAFAEDVITAKEAGLDDHLAKPIDIEKLKDILRKYLV